jgi:CubicO group peptidase (beta-lactamase class C family)
MVTTARIALVAICAALVLTTPPATAADSAAAVEQNSQRVEAIVAERLKAIGAPGVAIAVVHEGRTELAKGYGLASVEFGVAADQDTLFQLASISKIFTGVAVVRLAKAGKFSLEDPIGKYLHDLPADWARTPIKNLLNHTSGLPDYFGGPEYFAAALDDKLDSFDAALALALEKPREFPLGDHWSYNQTGYALVGKLIEVTTGSSFERYLLDNVIRPAGMRTAAYTGANGPAISKLNPTIYGRNADGAYVRCVPRCLLIYAPAIYPAGGLNASASDMARLLIHVDKDLNSLSRAWAKQYQATVRFGSFEPGWRYGLGFVILDVDGHLAVGHGGGQGFAWLLLFPEDRLGVAVMTNLDGQHALPLAQDIAKVYLQPKRR